MLKAITFPAERAEEALGTVKTLVDPLYRTGRDVPPANEELEFAGELQKDFMKRLVRIPSGVRKARAKLKELTSTKAPPSPKGGDW